MDSAGNQEVFCVGKLYDWDSGVVGMVRASKLPFKNFEFNIQRAEALAHLDGYLEDLLNNEGKRTIGVFLSVPEEIMEAFEINKLMKDFEKHLEAHLKTKFDKKGKQHFEEIAKNIARRLKPRVEKIGEIFQDLGLLMQQTLLEQALVLAVSSFEVYLKEIAISIIALNKRVRNRFSQEINAELSLSKLQDYRENSKRTQGEIVADRVRLDILSIRNLLERLTGTQSLLSDAKTKREVSRIFETRHVIVHRTGSVDPKYKKITKHKGAIDKKLVISRSYVLKSIVILKELVSKVEVSIHSRRSRKLDKSPCTH